MGWKAVNMPMESFDITILGEDMSLVSERLNYATLDNGKCYGIQHCFDKDSEEERLLREHLEAMHEHLIAINKIVNKEFYD
jgi:hypothetical protein